MDDVDADVPALARVFNPHRAAVPPHLAAVEAVDAREDFDQRGFACAVLPHEAVDLPLGDFKVDILQRIHAAELFTKFLRLQKHSVHSRRNDLEALFLGDQGRGSVAVALFDLFAVEELHQFVHDDLGHALEVLLDRGLEVAALVDQLDRLAVAVHAGDDDLVAARRP